jgi:hypothetical protein
MSISTGEEALALIRENIASQGHHLYMVAGGSLPRFAYTIGLTERCGAELILAGAAYFSNDEATQILNEIASRGPADGAIFELEGLGSLLLRKADAAWISELLPGAVDYYRDRQVQAWQVVPDPNHWTLDIPDMQQPWSAEPAWQWLQAPWSFPVAEGSKAVTELSVLRGGRVLQAARWKEDQWGLFAGGGQEIVEEQLRIVPLAMLLGADPSLERVTSMPVGAELWRHSSEHEWQASK